MPLEELNFLMEMDEAGVELFDTDQSALSERVREWFATPEGTVADLPAWGHRLSRLKFEPPGPDTEVMAEMLITEKLMIDVKDLAVRGLSVEFREIDLMYLVIDFGVFVFEDEVRL